jgi:hypothetical protein
VRGAPKRTSTLGLLPFMEGAAAANIEVKVASSVIIGVFGLGRGRGLSRDSDPLRFYR